MRRYRPAPEWQPDGHGIGDWGDNHDFQVSGTAAFSVRHVCPDVPAAAITVSFYVVELTAHPGWYVVHRHVEWVVWDDAADALAWSDQHYDSVSSPAWTEPTRTWNAIAEAEAVARECAESADVRDYSGWDGQPFENTEAV